MLIDLYKHLRFGPLEAYQYVGFGSVAFVDFRMIHRSLGINDLSSIEWTDDPQEQLRFERNKPYDQIDLRFGNSSQILPQLDFDRHSLVWLDYDNTLRRSMASDMAIVASKARSGTFLAVTFTNSFPTEKAAVAKALENLKVGFPEFVPDDAKEATYQGPKYAEFARQTLGALLDTALADADAGTPDHLEKRVAFQVCFFKYKDGAQMATIGWIIVSEKDLPTLELCRLESLPFYRDGSRAFKIEVPKVTPLEIREMERCLPSPETAGELDWIPEAERRAFSRSYRYLPSFASVEAI